jgi:hypothetical protein
MIRIRQHRLCVRASDGALDHEAKAVEIEDIEFLASCRTFPLCLDITRRRQ